VSDLATATITVAGVYDEPALVDDCYFVPAAGVLTVDDPGLGLLANDEDPDGDLAVASHTGPVQGTLAVNPDGTFTYTPTGTGSYADNFSYSWDADGDPAANVTLHVHENNQPPTAPAAAYEGTYLEGVVVDRLDGLVAGADADGDGDLLWASVSVGPSVGEVTVHCDGSFTYTPDADPGAYTTWTLDGGTRTATASFTYELFDGLDSAAGEVTLTLTTTVRQPFGPDLHYTMRYQDGSLSIQESDLLAHVTPGEGGTPTVKWDSVDGDDRVMADPEAGTLTFTPDEPGQTTFTYTVLDHRHRGCGERPARGVRRLLHDAVGPGGAGGGGGGGPPGQRHRRGHRRQHRRAGGGCRHPHDR